NLNLSDIAGLKDVRDQFVLNVFAPMDPKYAPIYRKYRGEDRGLQVLLYGPPGTGKTHAVKCLAGALGCKIAVVQIKDVMANLVGDGAKIIAEIFEQANKLDKCIIFFDEIDAIAASREGDESTHTKEQLTTLLTYMDGFTGKAKPGQVRIVIAATNRPWTLDSAVLRGGRFDTQIYVPMPDVIAREQLVRLALGKDPKVKQRVDIPCAPDVTVEWLASRFEGYAGADIKSICRQAASLPMKREIIALGNGTPRDDMITRDDFETIFTKYINSTTDEDLMEFDAYRLGMPFDHKYIDYKLDQIIIDLYNDKHIEKFEARMLRDAMETNAFREKFGAKYDLSFLPAKLRELLGE
ncbi:MAG: ATP-binding protein, partial [Clostridia bacterium]|nr:ATP-binding protein [Clostridia bacterium]